MKKKQRLAAIGNAPGVDLVYDRFYACLLGNLMPYLFDK